MASNSTTTSTPTKYNKHDRLSIFFFFFSLFHQRADDEVLTRLIQISLFLVASPILVKSIFFSFRSSHILYCNQPTTSIHRNMFAAKQVLTSCKLTRCCCVRSDTQTADQNM